MTTSSDAIRVFTLRSASGVTVRLMDFGATLMRVDAPDRHGRFGNILLGYEGPADYLAVSGRGNDAYLGATCGRFANRIAGSAFTLDGRQHRLTANEGRHQLHGGPAGFHQRRWDTVAVGDRRVMLRLRSDDGDQGFPGVLDAVADFALSDDGALTISYTASTSRPTHVNLVSHGYFNLAAQPGSTILDHRLRIGAAQFLPTDAEAIPLGTRADVAGTPFDFTTPQPIGTRLDQLSSGTGFNHCYVLREAGARMRTVAMLDHLASGRTLSIATDQPGLQFYSGDFLGGDWGRHAGLCLEAQHWPDSPNRPAFPSTRLDPGALYRSEIRLRPGLIAER